MISPSSSYSGAQQAHHHAPMNQQRILTVLYDMAVIMSGETRVEPLINKTLQRLMFHTGSACGVFLSDKNSRVSLSGHDDSPVDVPMRLEAALGHQPWLEQLGNDFVLPYAQCCGTAVLEQDSSMAVILLLSDSDHPYCLSLPIPQCGLFLLFFKQAFVSEVPLTRMFEPVLQNFSKLLGLCRINEEYTQQLLVDRDHAFAGLGRSRAALDATADNIFLINPNTITFVDFNRSALEDLGYSRSELLTYGPHDINPDLSAAAWQTVFQRMINKSLGYKEILTVHSRKDGSHFPVEMRLNLFYHDEDSVPVVIAVARDISDRVKTEHELQGHRQHLEKLVAKRTAALTEANTELESFSYSVSHDLRAPLRAIEGFSEALLEDHVDQLDTVGLDYLNRVKKASIHMSGLIDNILVLSKVSLHELDCNQINISRLAGEVVNDLMEGAGNRAIEWRIEKNVLTYADGRMLRIALENLLGNAVKYTSHEPLAIIEFGSLSYKGQPAYFIQDNGVGFDMRLAEKLFVPFQRLHKPEEFSGSGIGLATVMRIIHHHGGKVWAESELGSGAKFIFTVA